MTLTSLLYALIRLSISPEIVSFITSDFSGRRPSLPVKETAPHHAVRTGSPSKKFPGKTRYKDAAPHHAVRIEYAFITDQCGGISASIFLLIESAPRMKSRESCVSNQILVNSSATAGRTCQFAAQIASHWSMPIGQSPVPVSTVIDGTPSSLIK